MYPRLKRTGAGPPGCLTAIRSCRKLSRKANGFVKRIDAKRPYDHPRYRSSFCVGVPGGTECICPASAPGGRKLRSGVVADAQKGRPRSRRRDRDQALRVAGSTATAGKIFVCRPHFCHLAFSVHELPHVASQIVLIALAPRQQIDARRQPVHVVVRI